MINSHQQPSTIMNNHHCYFHDQRPPLPWSTTIRHCFLYINNGAIAIINCDIAMFNNHDCNDQQPPLLFINSRAISMINNHAVVFSAFFWMDDDFLRNTLAGGQQRYHTEHDPITWCPEMVRPNLMTKHPLRNKAVQNHHYIHLHPLLLLKSCKNTMGVV